MHFRHQPTIEGNAGRRCPKSHEVETKEEHRLSMGAIEENSQPGDRWSPIIGEVQNAKRAKLNDDVRNLAQFVLGEIQALHPSEGHKTPWHAPLG